jgi:hypothetical protein
MFSKKEKKRKIKRENKLADYKAVRDRQLIVYYLFRLPTDFNPQTLTSILVINDLLRNGLMGYTY